MNKFETEYLPAKIEKQNNKKENQDDFKSPEDRMQYLANKFVEIFNDRINSTSSVIGKPNLQDPEIMRIYINASLQRLCDDPSIDTETAKNINNIIRASDLIRSANKDMPISAKQYDSPLGIHEKQTATALYGELEKIFPESAMNLIRGRIE